MKKKDNPCNHKDFQFKASQAKNHKEQQGDFQWQIYGD